MRFVNQSQSVEMQNQSKCEITFDTQLKTALSDLFCDYFNPFNLYIMNTLSGIMAQKSVLLFFANFFPTHFTVPENF